MISNVCRGQRRNLAMVMLLAGILVVMTGCIAPIAAIPIATGSQEATAVAEEPIDLETEEGRIANAMSAAPASIAENATILDWPTSADSGLPELRAGTNGWVCVPDRPGTPTNDPMCLDEQWMIWFYAFLSGTEPEITAVGINYMLQGGSDPDNDDPTMMEPADGDDWMISPPHIMIVFPKEVDTSGFSTDHTNGGPWLMFRGTPYEHLMVPVEDLDHSH